jgi:hypothetical protein
MDIMMHIILTAGSMYDTSTENSARMVAQDSAEADAASQEHATTKHRAWFVSPAVLDAVGVGSPISSVVMLGRLWLRGW